jgi:Domain of unknown function DUF29
VSFQESTMPRNTLSYDQDFYAWTIDQARLLRSGELPKIDSQNIAEEIESLGRRDRRELIDRLENLIRELLKWRCQFGMRCGNWRSSILSQRFEIEQILKDSPSLRQFAAGRLGETYSDARERVIEELGLLQPDFPAKCPFTLDQVLSHSFLPEG